MNLRHAVTLVCSLVALAASTASAGVYSDYVINNTDPVIYWGQNEASGATAFDSVTAGGANDGTYAAAGSHAITLGDAGPRPSDGFFNMDAGNNAPFVSYQGTTKYNSLNSVAGVGTGSYSVQLWFNSSVPFTDNYLQYVFTRGSGTGDADRRDGVYVGGNYSGIVPNKLHLTTGIAGSHTLTIGSRTLSEDTWYHFLFVRDGDDCKAYINGKLEVQHTDPWDGGDGEYLTAANRTDYESFASSNGLGVHGRYDEVAVWDRALSDYEASNLYLQAFDTQDKPYMAAVLRNAPEAYWQLNETTGTNTAADATGNGHNVAYYTPVYSSTPTRTGTGTDVGPRPAEFGGFTADNNAPTLPGDEHAPGDDDGFVIVPQNVLNGQNDYSAEMWFRRGSLGTYGAYLMHRNDLGNGNGGDYLGLWQDGRLFIYDGNAPGISGTTQTAQNEWYHVGIARSGDNVTVYLNGLPEITTTMASWGEDWVDGTWTFGGRNDARHDLGQEFSGNIDEIAIYGEALGQNDFQENYLTAKVRRDSPYAQSVLSDTPEAYWRLDETSPYTLAVDAAGHGHTFEYHASASRTGTGSDVGPSSPAYIGFEPDNNAPRLEGTPNTSYIGIAEDLLAGQNDYTAEMWIRPNGDQGKYGSIYMMHRNDLGAAARTGDFFGLINDPDHPGEVVLFGYNGDDPEIVWGSTSILADQWYHVAISREGDQVSLYVNGVLDSQGLMTLRSGTDWDDGTWTFGNRSDDFGNGQRFNGNIDEIAIYGRVLSEAEIMAHFQAAVPEPAAALLMMLGGLGLVAGRRRKR